MLNHASPNAPVGYTMNTPPPLSVRDVGLKEYLQRKSEDIDDKGALFDDHKRASCDDIVSTSFMRKYVRYAKNTSIQPSPTPKKSSKRSISNCEKMLPSTTPPQSPLDSSNRSFASRSACSSRFTRTASPTTALHGRCRTLLPLHG